MPHVDDEPMRCFAGWSHTLPSPDARCQDTPFARHGATERPPDAIRRAGLHPGPKAADPARVETHWTRLLYCDAFHPAHEEPAMPLSARPRPSTVQELRWLLAPAAVLIAIQLALALFLAALMHVASAFEGDASESAGDLAVDVGPTTSSDSAGLAAKGTADAQPD